MVNQPVSLEQLARLYQARNDANKRMSQALRSKDKMLIDLATNEATNFNRVYASALRGYKRQKKAASRDKARTQTILHLMEQLGI